jgi:hypothetical protein
LALALIAKFRLEWEDMAWKNTLAYFAAASVTKKRDANNLDTCCKCYINYFFATDDEAK